LRRARSVTHTSGNNKALPRHKLNYAIFEIDEEPPIKHEEEFVDVVMFMPVILTLHHGHPDNRIVHLAKRLVVPFVGASVSQLLHIDNFERSMQNVEVSFVRKILPRSVGIHGRNLITEQPQTNNLLRIEK